MTVDRIEVTGDDPYLVRVKLKESSQGGYSPSGHLFGEPLQLGGQKCQAGLYWQGLRLQDWTSDALVYRECTKQEVEMLERLEGKAVELRAPIRAVRVGDSGVSIRERDLRNQIEISDHDWVPLSIEASLPTINGWLPKAMGPKTANDWVGVWTRQNESWEIRPNGEAIRIAKLSEADRINLRSAGHYSLANDLTEVRELFRWSVSPDGDLVLKVAYTTCNEVTKQNGDLMYTQGEQWFKRGYEKSSIQNGSPEWTPIDFGTDGKPNQILANRSWEGALWRVAGEASRFDIGYKRIPCTVTIQQDFTMTLKPSSGKSYSVRSTVERTGESDQMRAISYLHLRANVDIIPRPDGDNKGGSAIGILRQKGKSLRIDLYATLEDALRDVKGWIPLDSFRSES